MFKGIKTLFAATLMFSVLNASAAGIPACPTIGQNLTPAQCTKLRSDLSQYIVYVKAWLAAQSASNQARLKPVVDAAIAEANRLVNNACPIAPPAVTRFECIVSNSEFTGNVSVGVADVGAGITNDALVAQKPACMSSAACLTIVSNKLFVQGTLQSTRCNPPDATVVPLTDAEVQTKINAIP